MDEDAHLETIAGLLADPTARHILREIRREPQSAAAVSETAAASQPTVYRRLTELRELDLVLERQRIDPEGGHHHGVFGTDLDRVVVELDESGFQVVIERHEPMSDRFTRLIEGM